MNLKFYLLSFFLIGQLTVQAQDLISFEYKGERSLTFMQANFGFFMQNGVEMYKITYTTPDIHGVLDTASGLLVLPVRDEVFSYPLLCYQHGTVGSKTDVPSNLQGGWELAAVWGGLGYVTAAPDFLGLGEARGFHPYVHADTEASAGLDMMRAVRQYGEEHEVYINDQVFVTGYSQGGHAAAALHKEIQENHSDEFDLAASAPMSGPYSISGAMKEFILSDEIYFFPAYFPYTILSYNLAYDLFDDVEEIFKQPYADRIREFGDGEITLGTLNDDLIDMLTDNTGASVTKRMIQDSIIEAVVNIPDHPYNLALEDNDVYDWAPEVPTRLLYCMADDQVVYTNSIIADSVMNANGAANVMAIDVDSDADHGGCVEPAVISGALFFGIYQQISPVVGVEDVFGKVNEVSAYPNPAEGFIALDVTPQNALVQLLDANGKVQLEERLHTNGQQIVVDQLPAGLYFIQVVSDEGYWNGKVMIR